MAELKRLLLSPKQIITLLMLAVINLALFSGYCRNVQEEQDAYVKIQTKSLRTLVQKASDVQHEEELAYVTNGYYEYLDYVQAQSVQQGILGKLSAKGSFVTRNLEKTAKDYEKLKGIQLTAGENTGIRAVMNYRITDYLLLIAPLLLVLELSAEADSAIGALTRTTKRGRVPLCCIRILSLVILSAAAVLLLYGGNILYAVKTFGDPGLQRAIQSVPDFKYCTVRITVGGYYAAAALMLAQVMQSKINITIGIPICSILVYEIFNMLTIAGVPSGTWQEAVLGSIVIIFGVIAQRKVEGVVK